jgi:hypothetical protein
MPAPSVTHWHDGVCVCVCVCVWTEINWEKDKQTVITELHKVTNKLRYSNMHVNPLDPGSICATLVSDGCDNEEMWRREVWYLCILVSKEIDPSIIRVALSVLHFEKLRIVYMYVCMYIYIYTYLLA